jgi:1-acyl-sn-glycerol-3-phosphate acyltransferase
MGGVGASAGSADRSPPPHWRAPRLWRVLLLVARVLVMPICRLRVDGALPAGYRDGPLILAVNHIGPIDPIVVMAACRVRRITPRIMATGGLFQAPVLGAVLRHCGQIRVNRRQADVSAALPAAHRALEEGSVLLGYPEGRITLDPGGWPERGRTGLARLALATGAPVVPVAQWGAHLLAPWGSPRGMAGRLCWALVHRPVVRVAFGAPVPLAGAVTGGAARSAREATDRIMDAITDGLRRIRVDEPRLPAWIDPNRPVSVARSHRYRAGAREAAGQLDRR